MDHKFWKKKVCDMKSLMLKIYDMSWKLNTNVTNISGAVLNRHCRLYLLDFEGAILLFNSSKTFQDYTQFFKETKHHSNRVVFRYNNRKVIIIPFVWIFPRISLYWKIFLYLNSLATIFIYKSNYNIWNCV